MGKKEKNKKKKTTSKNVTFSRELSGNIFVSFEKIAY